MSPTGRYLPDRRFPPYAHVPGRTPHPARDPDGHSHGAPAPVPTPVAPEEWARSSDFLLGVDLFNHGYYWEAHEAWEGLWRAAAEDRARVMLHGLIKLAAAGVKWRAGNAHGVARHAAGAADLFRQLTTEGGSRLYGLAPGALKVAAETLSTSASDGSTPEGLGIVLEPR